MRHYRLATLRDCVQSWFRRDRSRSAERIILGVEVLEDRNAAGSLVAPILPGTGLSPWAIRRCS